MAVCNGCYLAHISECECPPIDLTYKESKFWFTMVWVVCDSLPFEKLKPDFRCVKVYPTYSEADKGVLPGQTIIKLCAPGPIVGEEIYVNSLRKDLV